jgi:prolyl oligopeptidase
MYIFHPSGMRMDGQNPALLDGYGGFNQPVMPHFSTANILAMKHFGFILAFPALRGGGEYGERWHEEGMRERKQNVFDDFQAAAEYLIHQNYTRPEK